ncbi:hypothetical protein [Streptomyces sp. JJ36]|uniref:hypothetical protein n=1 Tax=Streptomyces sp. JJ36 TaxID=2736645 RepID=UPI001F406544|nr:hypothetical protein [Streptomyces sp. JJ36]MCF6523041.1 hypothetical protein [Streptomyces sp. JJ36]
MTEQEHASTAKVVALTSSGSAVLITEADPDDATLVHNAAQVLGFARTTMADPNLTADELRFVARQLAASLGDLLPLAGAPEE